MQIPDCPFEKIIPSELNRDAEYYMAHAYNQAIEAWKIDEVPIGAVIEHGGRIIASAHNRSRAPTTQPHTRRSSPSHRRHTRSATGACMNALSM